MRERASVFYVRVCAPSIAFVNFSLFAFPAWPAVKSLQLGLQYCWRLVKAFTCSLLSSIKFIDISVRLFLSRNSFVTNDAAATAENIRAEQHCLELRSMVLSHARLFDYRYLMLTVDESCIYM